MVTPYNSKELAEAIRAASKVRIVGTDSHRTLLPIPADGAEIVSTKNLTGLVDFSPDDQVVIVRAGTPISALQDALRESNQCLPWASTTPFGPADPTVGGAIMMNLPHRLEGRCGTWRDWILGLTIVQADGTIAKAGSRAVKNVAGYDLHRFLVGSRGTLALVTEVILRTFPIRSLPEVEGDFVGNPDADLSQGITVQRVLATDYLAATERQDPTGLNLQSTATLLRPLDLKNPPTRFKCDWFTRLGATIRLTDDLPTASKNLSARAKQLLDPDGKLNSEVF